MMETRETLKIITDSVSVPLASLRQGESPDGRAEEAVSKRLRRIVGRPPSRLMIHKKSVDARRRGDVKLVYSFCAGFDGLTERERRALADSGMREYSPAVFEAEPGREKLRGRVSVVGFGPAGMFAALALSEAGYRPAVYERGSSPDERVRKVSSFLRGGGFDCNTNVQFGAGGAGTFSDGKLTTRINDPLVSYVLSRLRRFGAPDDVEWKARPHVGTDVLRGVVSNIDSHIRRSGGDVIYDTKVTFSDGAFHAGGEKLAGPVVLAVGHSARDTYSELMAGGFTVEPKPFSVGVRIEHLQSWLDRAMFGDLAGDPSLGRAEYAFSLREGDRGVYTFCMCPGGVVIPSSSDFGEIVTNGMSNRSRDGRNANAALAVSVLPADFGSTPAGGIEYQRRLERAAFRAGGGDFRAPVQLVGDFLDGRPSTGTGKIGPTYMDGNVTPADLRSLLPDGIGNMIEKGICAFDKKLPGFADPEAPLTGFETRTSAPVRIRRNGTLEALGVRDVYPCGEGAGYAGGIVSAAVDGLRAAKAVINRYSPA